MPLKIVLIIFITEIIILVGLGIVLQFHIADIHTGINTGETISLEQIDGQLVDLSRSVDMILIVCSLLFVGIAIALCIYMSRVIVYPLNKYLKSKDEEKSTEQIEMGKIISHTTEGIVVFDREGKIALINPAAKRLLKISPEDNSFEDVFHKFDKNINIYYNSLLQNGAFV